MDINFHYFAVKTIALHAGYGDSEADEIAAYSQYVDDYFDSEPFVPKGFPPAFAAPLMQGNKVKPVKTGITIWESLKENEQREVIIPFHFIPPEPLSICRDVYITFPAVWSEEEGPLIVRMIQTLLGQHRYHPQFLMFLGMLLHIFADTYAHQEFNGFKNSVNEGWVHEAEVRTRDKTYKKTYAISSKLPPIGHARLGTAPDETALTYSCYRNDGTGKFEFRGERNNREVFLECAAEIFKILRAARNQNMPTLAEIEALNAELSIGFETDKQEIPELAEHWHSISGKSFGYDEKSIHLTFFELDEKLLPDGMDMLYARELLSLSKDEQNDDSSDREERERLFACGAVRPTNIFYYYNICAYNIRELVNL